MPSNPPTTNAPARLGQIHVLNQREYVSFPLGVFSSGKLVVYPQGLRQNADIGVIGMVTTVAHMDPAAEMLSRPVSPVSGDGEAAARVNLSDIAATRTDGSEKLSNPAALGDQVISGLHDLLQKSEHINRTLGADFDRAVERVRAREAHAAIGAPGVGGLLASDAMAFGNQNLLGRSRIGGATLPGPAEMHPRLGGGVDAQWEKLRDEQDRAFIRYNEFASYQLQSSELQKITEQLSNAVNTLVKAS